MFRLLGFLIGSLTSIILVLLIVGMPNFHLSEQKIDQQRYDEAIEKLKAKQREFESVAGKLSEDVARVAETVEHGMDALSSSMSDTTKARSEVPAEPDAPATDDTEALPAPVAGDLREAQQETMWFSFWNPFRSELAANGFVSQLESVTGIDYRVVKIKSGVYEVAFAYADDAERITKLSQIAAATGLDLPDS
jgi:hypothetical protein